MSKNQENIQETQEKKEKTTLIDIKIGTHLDQINPISTLDFKDSKDRGFTFNTSTLKFLIRMKERNYYNFIDTLISDVIDELQNLEDPRFDIDFIDGLQEYLCAKLNGDI